MNSRSDSLTFAWWNLHNFAHYDPARLSHARWPKHVEEYEAKRERVVTALHEIFAMAMPDLLAVCEISRHAAMDLVTKLGSDFSVTVSPDERLINEFHVAVFFRKGVGLTAELPLIPSDEEDVPARTRAMIPVHLSLPGHVIRFVACHWTAFDSSEATRVRLADVLRRDLYGFLHPESPTTASARHVIVLGDLNAEPTAAIFDSDHLNGRRDRRSPSTRHWRDAAVRRVRLYNAAWRYLGERVAHRAAEPHGIDAAGTYFKGSDDWRTFDHVLVSCGLLTPRPPYLDEAHTGVVPTAIMLNNKGLPVPFEPGSARGVSDHLPIAGRIVLQEKSE